MNRDLAIRILKVIKVFCMSPDITDTIWMPGRCEPTACEELASIAAELGATDTEIDRVFMYDDVPQVPTKAN